MNTWRVMLISAVLTVPALQAADTNTNPNPQTDTAPSTNTVAVTDQQVAQWMQQAVNFARAGYFEDAERRCRQIVAARPQHADARSLLKQIEDRRRQVDPGGALRRRLEQVKIPEVEFRSAEPAAVINFLREECRKLTTNAAPINFVWQVPIDTKLPAVTLNLRNVSAYDVAQYVAAATGLRMRVDEHAVVLALPAGGLPAPAPAR